MPGYDGMNGRQIIDAAKERIGKLGSELAVLADQTEYPLDHRSKLRRERTASIRQERAAATDALRVWAAEATADAKRDLAADDVGTAAAESRRVATELRISRLVASARAGGNETSAARDYAARANAAYESGNADEADALSQASAELAPNRLAQEVQALIAYDRIAASPSKSRAMKALDDVNVVITAASRDVNAAYSSALQKSAALAAAIGEPSNDVSYDMTAASVDAKMSAWLAAQSQGKPYQEPSGALPGSVVATVPEGAKLPDPRPSWLPRAGE
jgi:hypothetical protein